MFQIFTKAKAETPETRPAFSEKLKGLGPNDEALSAWKQHKADGFNTVLGVRSEGRITIGDIGSEWRPMGSTMFFLKCSQLGQLKDASLIEEALKSLGTESVVPASVYYKAYSYMSSCGRGWLGGMFTPSDVAEYIRFFECDKACFNTIDQLIINHKFDWCE